jgi:hypothetical protein
MKPIHDPLKMAKNMVMENSQHLNILSKESGITIK